MQPLDQLVQCVPNFSDGRDTETVEALAATIRAVGGAYVHHHHMDRDHHRVIVGVIGAPGAVVEGVFQAVRLAAERINLRQHRGEHPRVGATDVVPFVPGPGVSMEDCVELARSIGRRIGQELGIPVFLYEQAATQPHRRDLAAIRRGGLEGLARRMECDEAWRPDFGPPRPHVTAGVTAVAARPPLIAFNVNLQSVDVATAKAIARKIRASSGGLPGLKALGVTLHSRGLVQVSMNVTDYAATPLRIAFEAVQRQAEERGVVIESSEIVGVVPRRALEGLSQESIRLKPLEPTQVVETAVERILVMEDRGSDGRGG